MQIIANTHFPHIIVKTGARIALTGTSLEKYTAVIKQFLQVCIGITHAHYFPVGSFQLVKQNSTQFDWPGLY